MNATLTATRSGDPSGSGLQQDLDQARALRILLVSPHFAPSTAVGAKRFSFLAEHFTQLGHDVETLTLRRSRNERSDPTLPRPGRVHSIFSLFPDDIRGNGIFARVYRRVTRSIIGMPDHYVGWLPTSVVAGYRIARRMSPDVVIATGPPFTAFLTGTFLCRMSGVPLILDYRDPWTAYGWGDGGKSRRKSTLRRALERWAVGSASALVFATDVMRESFELTYAGARPDVREVVNNGFNARSYKETMPLTADAINILYAGSFYGQRRVSGLVDALTELQSRASFSDTKFAVHVFGRIRADDRSRIIDSGLVHEHDAVDHDAVLRFMMASDVLFLPSGSDVSYALPFKLFDYLSVRRPILAVSPEGSAVARLMAELDCGEVATLDEALPIADALERLLVQRHRYSYAGSGNFSWDRVADSYNGLLHRVLRDK